LGLIVLLVAAVSSGMLTLSHFHAMTLPGCGKGSACERAAASVFGSVPGLGLPTSFIGLAYFASAMVGWIVGKGALGAPSKWIVRAGGLVSLGLIGVVIVDKLPCVYCLTVHTANLVFWALVERTPGCMLPRKIPPLLAGAVVFVLTLGMLGLLDAQAKAAAKQRAEQQLAESTAAMVREQLPQSDPAAPKTADVKPETPSIDAPPAAPARQGFTGRYRFGPEKAVARIVMFTDYQCPDCYRIEGELKALMASNQNISVLVKMFPLCKQCNPKAGVDLHMNACWAARAAQTAGIIKGDAGFWEMHQWLFDHHGSFTNEDFPPALAAMGYDPKVFTQLMQTDQALAPITTDIDEGLSLGIFYTPMIFINGVELKGWNAPNALTRAVQAVLAANPSPDSTAVDRPPTALEKYMADWREQPVMQVPASVTDRALGRADAVVTVVVFGDYQESGTAEVDGLMRLFATGPDSKLKYVFAHYPVDQSCNPVAQMTLHAGACRCAKAAEGAAIMAGPDAFWKMHNWVMGMHGVFTDQGLDAEAAAEGLDAAALKEAMANPAVEQKIASDARAATSIGITSIPWVMINGKHVPRWKLDNENLLPRMIQEAAGK
jgi:protein-disulfide isomerase